MITTEFILTTLVMVLIPGTGVIYTVSMGLLFGKKASTYAAISCTIGIIPHLAASLVGLTAVLHMSALAFQILKVIGVLYLFYLAWSMWHTVGLLKLDNKEQTVIDYKQIMLKGMLINTLNPKLSLFFIAFIPQFVPASSQTPVSHMLLLSGVFMAMTLFVFILYGLCMDYVRHYLINSPKIMQGLQRSFASFFILLGLKLAWVER